MTFIIVIYNPNYSVAICITDNDIVFSVQGFNYQPKIYQKISYICLISAYQIPILNLIENIHQKYGLYSLRNASEV